MNFITKKHILIASVIVLAVLIGYSINYDIRLTLLWIAMVLALFFINKDEELFVFFFFVNIGLGATFNLQYRYTKVTLADISLVFFAVAVVICFQRIKPSFSLKKLFMHKDVFLLCAFFCISLFFGIIHRYSFYNVFQDIKLFIYFIIPYIYLKYKNAEKDKQFTKKIFFGVLISCLVICLQEILALNNIGIVRMVMNGFSNRDVGISIILVPVFASILAYLKISKTIRINFIIYYLLQILFVAACIISFTRSLWLQCGLTFVAFSLFIILKNKKYFIEFVKIICIIALIIAVIYNSVPKSYSNLFFSAVVKRLETTQLLQPSPSDTLQGRFDDSSVLLEKLKNVQTIWGFGFGDVIPRYDKSLETTFVENSFLYYTWKYGMIGSLLLVGLLMKRFRYSMKEGSDVQRIVALSTMVFIVVGNFSGNICLYYYMPIISLFLAYDFKVIEDKTYVIEPNEFELNIKPRVIR